jgi:cytidylate kinase
MGTYLKFLEKYEKKNIKKNGLTIAVSGLTGSGKDTVAKAISRAFNLKLINAGDIQRQFAKKNKIQVDKASAILPARIDYQMDRQTLNLARQGGYVISGRLSGWVAGDFADCRVLVHCPKNIRVKRISLRDGLSLSEAKTKVTRRDGEDKKRYKKLYRVNLDDKSIYNLIVNNGGPTIKEVKKSAVKNVKKFLKQKYDRRKK